MKTGITIITIVFMLAIYGCSPNIFLDITPHDTPKMLDENAKKVVRAILKHEKLIVDQSMPKE